MTPARHRTLATIRACDPAPPTDSRNVLFFVLSDFGYCRKTGRKIGEEWVARDPANMSRRETLVDIRSGELSNVVQIIEVEFTSAGISSRDVTEDMLAEVESVCRPEHAEIMSKFDRAIAALDHLVDERKHWSA
jgi:hypothetical protein